MLTGYAANSCYGIFTGSLVLLHNIFSHLLATHQYSGKQPLCSLHMLFGPPVSPASVLPPHAFLYEYTEARKPLLPSVPQKFSAMCLHTSKHHSMLLSPVMLSCFSTASRGGKMCPYSFPKAFSLSQPPSLLLHLCFDLSSPLT